MPSLESLLVDATLFLGYMNALLAMAFIAVGIRWLAMKVPAVRRWLDLP